VHHDPERARVGRHLANLAPRHLGAKVSSASASMLVGNTFTDAGSAVDVMGPDGKRAISLKDSATTQAFRLTGEGFFELRRANGRNELIAVHADRRESDLDVVPRETLALWQGTGATGSGGAGKGPVGQADNTDREYNR